MEQKLAFKLQEDGIFYQTQVEIPVTTADFYFPTQPRPLVVFVDGRVQLGKVQMSKDEELRTLLRKRGYRILEIFYESYSDKKRDQLYEEIQNSLAKLGNLGRGSRPEDLKGSKRGPLRERGLTHSAQSEWSLVRAQWGQISQKVKTVCSVLWTRCSKRWN